MPFRRPSKTPSSSQSQPVAREFSPLAPSVSRMALETRILFDGAGAVAGVDAFADDSHQAAATAQQPDAHEAVIAASMQAHGLDAYGQGDDLLAEVLLNVLTERAESQSGQTLLVIDTRVDGYQDILVNLPANVQVRVVGQDESGLEAVSQALASGGGFESVHIVSHGVPGAMVLGADLVDAAVLAGAAEQVQAWSQYLTQGADILLYGCDIALGADGQAFIQELSRLTRADIAASTDATGWGDQGGNWQLEAATGSIETSVFALEGLRSVLSAVPKVEIVDLPDANEVLIGDSFEFSLNFENASGNPTDVGYGPYIDLFLPKGADGDDGINIAASGAITYLGADVTYQIITLDDAGKAWHPYAKNTAGGPVQIVGQAGQKVVVIELPFGSYTTGQPKAQLMVSASLSNFADRGQALELTARAGFRYGNTPLPDYATDPSLIGTAVSTSITPTLVEYHYTFDHAEGETATGPNFAREMSTSITVAPGQTISDYEFKIDVPDNIVVTHVNGQALDTPVSGAQLRHVLGTISGTQDVVIKYYVTDVEANTGQNVLDPQRGGAGVSEFQVSGSGRWTPMDPRDLAEVVTYDPAGIEFQHQIKSIAVQKSVTNQTDAQNSPGDVLRYQLDFQVSDYFRFKDVVITDKVEDGHALSGTPTLELSYQGVIYQIDLTGFYTDSAPDANDDVTRTFNISAAVAAYAAANGLSGDMAQGWLRGGKFDGDDAGATSGRIVYDTIIENAFVSPVGSGTPEIDHGDHLLTFASIGGTLVKADGTDGDLVTDATDTDVEIAGGQLQMNIIWVNGQPFPAGAVDIKPGDTVTYELEFDLMTGDFENLQLDAYLPKPVFDVMNTSWTHLPPGTGVPGVGQWVLVPSDVTSAINKDASLVVDKDSNGLKFVLGSRDDPLNTAGQKVVIRFTVQVSDRPFADGLHLTAQGQATDHNTQQDAATQQQIAQIRLNQPVLEIKHGVVSTDREGVISSGTTGTWKAPGDTGQPFTGTINNINGIDGDISKVDAGDRVRFGIGIINTGGSGAFDIRTGDIQVPEGFKLVQANGVDAASLADANLKIYRGDGTLLEQGRDYTISGGVITFSSTGGGVDLGRGQDREHGTQVTDGSNVLIITYDALALADIAAGKVITSTAEVVDYAGVDGGADHLPGTSKISDTASVSTNAPTVKVVFKDGSLSDDDSSASHTTGADMVIGESMDYDIVVTLPEGTTHDLVVSALVPDGMMLDTSYNGGLGYEIISVAGGAGSGALSGDFVGSALSVSGTSWAGTADSVGADLNFSFGDVVTTGNNLLNDNSFVIRVRLIAANNNTGVHNNQEGTQRTMDARLTYDKGGVDTNTQVNSSGGSAPIITIREPQLVIEKTVDTDTSIGAPGQQNTPIDAGDEVEYTIRIKHGANSQNAFDLIFTDTFHSALTMNGESLTIERGAQGFTPGSGTDISALFSLSGNVLTSVEGSNIDLAAGEEIVITISGKANATVAMHPSFDSQAQVRWSSLDSDSNKTEDRRAHERDGRDGAGADNAVLNNYVASDGAVVNVAATYELSRIGGLEDTGFTGDTRSDAQNVAVGEIVRFRLVMKLPEGQIDNLNVRPNLPPGYVLLQDGASWALVGDKAANFSVNGVSQGNTGRVVSDDASVYGNIENTLSSGNTADISQRPGLGGLVLNNGMFQLGTIINGDDDDDAEYIVLEFNAVVSNIAGVAAGSALSTTVTVLSDATELGTSNTTVDTVVEPQISAIVKDVVDMAAGTQGTSAEITVSNKFSTGTDNAAPAYEVKLADKFPNGSNYQLESVIINGQSYAADSLPEGVAVSTSASGIEVTFDKLDPGTSVEVRYTTSVTTAAAQGAVPAADATLTWSSLPDTDGSISETGFAGVKVGADGSATGERDGSGTGVNTYVQRDSAGYGTISGILWDDTSNRDGVVGTDELRLANETVSLRWAGADGIFGNEDDRVLTVTTNANGEYNFGALVAGKYRLEAPDTVTRTFDVGTVNEDTDALAPRHDADGAANGLGTIELTLTEGQVVLSQNVGYLRVNDAPSFSGVGGSVSYTEGQNTAGDSNVIGTPVRLTGDVFVNDPELVGQGLDTFAGTTLTVGRGSATDFAYHADDILAIGAVTAHGSSVTVNGSDVLVDGVVVGALSTGSGSLVVTFNAKASSATVNAVASAITYANSSHTPDASVSIRYRFNDANDDDKQGSGGALSGDALVAVNITAVNDPPVATNDGNGLTNIQATVNGNVIQGSHTDGAGTALPVQTPDSDPDTPLADLTISRIEVTTAGHTPGVGQDAAKNLDGAPITIAGKYGMLTFNPDGSYSYALDRDNPAVYGLGDGLILNEVFEYTLSDGELTDTALLTIKITGTPPTAPLISAVDGNGAANGHNTVHERGLTSEADTSESVTGDITVTASGGIDSVKIGGVEISIADLNQAASTPIEITTTHGKLIITGFTPGQGEPASAPRSGLIHYHYAVSAAVDNDSGAPGVSAGDALDTIALEVNDRLWPTPSTGSLLIHIVDDVPVAKDDAASLVRGQADTSSGLRNQVSGNVYDNDRIGADGADPSGPVMGIAPGTPGSEPIGGLGADVLGAYGKLVLNTDGSYVYVLDADHPVVAALSGEQSLTDTFTYTIKDGDGDTSTAALTITIRGNTPPVAVDDVRVTPEDTPISGNVISGDTDGDHADGDADGNPLTLTQIQLDADGDGTPETYPIGDAPITVNIPGKGVLVIGKDGAYTFTPVADWHGGVPPVTYTVTDGLGGEDTATLSITVTPVPDAVPDVRQTESSTPVSLSPLENDSFSNPDAKVTEVTQGKFGTVVIEPDGRITYTPQAGLSGTDTFTYTVLSGGVSETTTVTIEVRPDNGVNPPDSPWTGVDSARPDPRNPFANSVVGEPSVYFYGEVFDRLPRMDLPFHPIVYVNGEVERTQSLREQHDMRARGGLGELREEAQLEARLSSQRLAMAQTLYVHHELQQTQQLALRWRAMVEGEADRGSLSGGGILPTPDLFGIHVNGWPTLLERLRQGQDQPEQEVQEASEAEAVLPESAEIAAASRSGDAEAVSQESHPVTMSAPSFSEQLRSGRGHLPGVLHAPHKTV